MKPVRTPSQAKHTRRSHVVPCGAPEERYSMPVLPGAPHVARKYYSALPAKEPTTALTKNLRQYCHSAAWGDRRRLSKNGSRIARLRICFGCLTHARHAAPGYPYTTPFSPTVCPQVEGGRVIRVTFDGGTADTMPWTFRPTQSDVRVSAIGFPGHLVGVMRSLKNTNCLPVDDALLHGCGAWTCQSHLHPLHPRCNHMTLSQRR